MAYATKFHFIHNYFSAPMKFLENLEFSVTALFTQDSEEPVLDDNGEALFKADGTPKKKKVKSKSFQISFRDSVLEKELALAVVKYDDLEPAVAKEMMSNVFEKFPLQVKKVEVKKVKKATEPKSAPETTEPETLPLLPEEELQQTNG